VIEVGLSIIYSGLLVPDPVYKVHVVKENIIGPGQSTEEFMEVIRPSQMTFAQAKAVWDGNGSIWVAGYVSYDDVFDERRVHRFFQRFVAVVPRDRYVLQAVDFKHYNKSD
jgi:hypothetical protein